MQTRSLPAGRDRDETLGVPWPPPPPPHPTGPPLTIPAAQRCRGPTLEGGEEMAAERLRNVVRFEVTPQEQREPLKIDALVGGGAESGWGGGSMQPTPPTAVPFPGTHRWGAGASPLPGGAATGSRCHKNPAARPAPSCCCLESGDTDETAPAHAHACTHPAHTHVPTSDTHVRPPRTHACPTRTRVQVGKCALAQRARPPTHARVRKPPPCTRLPRNANVRSPPRCARLCKAPPPS